ncbi:MAG TPA: hypothetical protein VNL17_15685 [Verrucomicrobiae bacterium]|nr:hypothetical protein [Verrucomicrobiae bacterium]
MSEAPDRLWQCQDKRCGVMLRAAELQRMVASGLVVDACPRCGGPVARMNEEGTAVEDGEPTGPPPSFAAALAYPFRGGGLFVLGVGTIVIGVIAYGLPFLYGYVISLIVYGCMLNYLFDVVLTTANGEDKPPGLPDFSDWVDDIFQPILLMISTTVLCFVPSFLYFIGYLWHCWYEGWVPDLSEPACAWGVVGLALVSLYYYPMALLAVVMFNSKRVVSPRVVIPSIARVWRPYLVVCGFMTVIGLTVMVFRVVVTPGSLLEHFGGVALKLWGGMASMRLLGLLYRTHKSRLGWF